MTLLRNAAEPCKLALILCATMVIRGNLIGNYFVKSFYVAVLGVINHTLLHWILAKKQTSIVG